MTQIKGCHMVGIMLPFASLFVIAVRAVTVLAVSVRQIAQRAACRI
jgi:hypothetical protein